jgi:hypothetical protein
MSINKSWHQKHPMPENPNLEQRLQWHIAHAKACHCREIPDSIQKELTKRKIKIDKTN